MKVQKLWGLTSIRVAARQKRYGFNELDKKKKTGIWLRLIKRTFNPLILMLLFSSLLSVFLGQRTDFFIILVILILSVVIDTYQEHSAENAVEKLIKKVALTAKVIRDGKLVEVANRLVTIDDMVVLETGDMIPADAIVAECEELTVNQSALTGESFPQLKKNGDRVFMGTFVLSGSAKVKVIDIGRGTEIGKISSQLSTPRAPTEFERGLNKFSFMLVRVTGVFAVILLLVNIMLGHSIFNSALFVLALAIGFAPELLPMILTINLANGAIHLSKKGVIVKFLPAIENFGSMEVLCTDKTGTLTEGNTSLSSYLDVEGKLDDKVLEWAYVNSFYQPGFKNPLETAILKRHLNVRGKYKKLDEISYDFYRRRVSILVKHEGRTLLITKGAPEDVLMISSNKKEVKCDYESFHRNGLRTLAVAIKYLPEGKLRVTETDEAGMKLVGFLTFTDPPKENVTETLQMLERFGVGLKILTGDNELITKYVCDQLKIEVKGVTVGQEIDKLNDKELTNLVQRTTVFARLNPEQKQKIILALKQSGKVVGYMGDGINDATSLKAADVGISVNNAVDVAKESADLILLHKDLRVLLVGIEAGRTTFANILKYIMMGTSSTFGNMLSLSAASILLPFLPLLPVQVLLNDLVYDISQILIVKDSVDENYILTPRKWSIKFIDKFMVYFGTASSIFDLLTFYVLLHFFRATPDFFQTGWFLESMTTQLLVIFCIRTTMVPFWRSRPNPVFAWGIAGLLAAVLYLPYSPVGGYFHFVPMPLNFYLMMGTISMAYLLLIELIKKNFYKARK